MNSIRLCKICGTQLEDYEEDVCMNCQSSLHNTEEMMF